MVCIPYKLSVLAALRNEKIDAIVTQNRSGAYALDKSATGGFQVSYVGRADDDVNKRLKDWVGKYKFFEFDYATSPKDAYEKECELWHDFGGADGKLDNKIHPDCPEGTNWKCPNAKCDKSK